MDILATIGNRFSITSSVPDVYTELKAPAAKFAKSLWLKGSLTLLVTPLTGISTSAVEVTEPDVYLDLSCPSSQPSILALNH